MSRWPLLADILGFELLAIAKAMADGSWYRQEADPEIGYCGVGSTFADWE